MTNNLKYSSVFVQFAQSTSDSISFELPFVKFVSSEIPRPNSFPSIGGLVTDKSLQFKRFKAQV